MPKTFEDFVTEDFPFTKEEFECIVEFLARELLLETLYALRNLLYILRAYVEAYALLYLTPTIDRALEQAIMETISKEAQKVVQEGTKLRNEIFKYIPGDRITQCPGFNNFLNKLEAASGIFLGSAAMMANYLSKYAIVSGLESYRDQVIAECLGYIDALIACVDSAISFWGTANIIP